MTTTGKKKITGSQKAQLAKTEFSHLIKTYAKKHKLDQADRNMFKNILGYGRLTNSMLASDLKLRCRATNILAKLLVDLHLSRPNLNFYLFTFSNDFANTSDRTPIIEINKMQRSIDQVFRKLKLSSLSALEIQGVGNYPRKRNGRLLMLHGHTIAWTERSVNCGATMRELNSSPFWVNSLGAKPIDVRLVTPTRDDLAYISYYIFKAPYEVKMIENRKCGPRLKSTTKGYQPEFAVRILECLSQLELKVLVRSANEGVSIRKEWSRRLTYWHRSRPQWNEDKVDDAAVNQFWDRIRRKKRRVKYQPYKIQR